MGKRESWMHWKNKGYSDKAVAAIMGNIEAESAFLSNNVENRCPMSDADYTARVDDGRIRRQQFLFDSYGYGYYQHTFWSRKAGLYDLCKKRGKSIADENCQHDWAEQELHQGEYASVYRVLWSDTSLEEMTRVFMCQFERPADQSRGAINYRTGLARAIYNEFAGSTPEPTPEPEPPKKTYWPPRMIDKNMDGADVEVLQAVLKARGYAINFIGGKFNDLLTEELKKFQADHGLTADGVCGPLTWAVILKI
jgi:hypothetical protein